MAFPPDLADDSLNSWEFIRKNLSSSLETIHQSFSTLTQSVLELITNIRPQNIQRPPNSTSLKRRLAFDLFEKGLTIRDAMKTSEKFFDYCSKNSISPKDIIDGELNRISSHLSAPMLKDLQIFEHDAVFLNHQAEEKEKILSKSKLYASYSQSTLATHSQIFLLLLSLFLIPSCGIKTAPKSDIEDFRPEVPTQIKEPENQSNKEIP